MVEFLSPYMPVVSLIVLIIVVAVGFIKKINLGFFALGAAFILTMLGGLPASAVTKGFSSSMFVTLVGVTFLFGMASQNGTLDLLDRKSTRLNSSHCRISRMPSSA